MGRLPYDEIIMRLGYQPSNGYRTVDRVLEAWPDTVPHPAPVVAAIKKFRATKKQHDTAERQLQGMAATAAHSDNLELRERLLTACSAHIEAEDTREAAASQVLSAMVANATEYGKTAAATYAASMNRAEALDADLRAARKDAAAAAAIAHWATVSEPGDTVDRSGPQFYNLSPNDEYDALGPLVALDPRRSHLTPVS